MLAVARRKLKPADEQHALGCRGKLIVSRTRLITLTTLLTYVDNVLGTWGRILHVSNTAPVQRQYAALGGVVVLLAVGSWSGQYTTIDTSGRVVPHLHLPCRKLGRRADFSTISGGSDTS